MFEHINPYQQPSPKTPEEVAKSIYLFIYPHFFFYFAILTESNIYKIYKNANNKQQQSTWIKSRSLFDDSAKKYFHIFTHSMLKHTENRLFLLQRSFLYFIFYILLRFVLLVRIVIFVSSASENCISTQIQQFSKTKSLYKYIYWWWFFVGTEAGKTKTMCFLMSKNTNQTQHTSTRNTCWAKCIDRIEDEKLTASSKKKMQRNLNAS